VPAFGLPRVAWKKFQLLHHKRLFLAKAVISQKVCSFKSNSHEIFKFLHCCQRQNCMGTQRNTQQQRVLKYPSTITMVLPECREPATSTALRLVDDEDEDSQIAKTAIDTPMDPQCRNNPMVDWN
jgi:hypothetical protein